jgi:arsenite methyltransferase
MEKIFTCDQRDAIAKGVRTLYAKAAQSPAGIFRFPTGRAGLQALNYNPALLDSLPNNVAESYCGVGNPYTLGPVNLGWRVLDIGSGAGVDAILAAWMTGDDGSVVGMDVVPEMVECARRNALAAEASNLEFMEGSAEDLPFGPDEFDLIISNGAFNLVVDKPAALSQVFRVLKPGAMLQVADQVLVGELPSDMNAICAAWAR